MSHQIPQLPPLAAHAEHMRPLDHERDVDRDVDRARALAAERLEGSHERLEQQRLEQQEQMEREQRHRELYEREQRFDESRRNVPSDVDSELDYEEKAGPSYTYSNNPSRHQSLAQKGKSAFARFSKAVFKFPGGPNSPTSPYPRERNSQEFLPTHRSQNSIRSTPSRFPSRLTDLSPWPALAPHKRSDTHDGPIETHHHYYGGSHAPPASSAGGGRELSEHDAHDHGYANGDSEQRKLGKCAGCHQTKKKQRRSNLWCIILFILLLILLANTIFLNVRILSPSVVNSDAGSPEVVSGSSGTVSGTVARTGTAGAIKTGTGTGTQTVSSPQSTSTATTVSAELSDCLAQFANLGSSAASYPCSQCIPHLTSVANDLLDGTSPPVTGQGNALQFCALQAVSNLASANDGSKPLQAVGWLKDNKICTWTGVTCDDKARVRDMYVNSEPHLTSHM